MIKTNATHRQTQAAKADSQLPTWLQPCLRGWRLMALLTLLVFAMRVAYLVLWHPYGLGPDEAQYWSWLARNDWSFLTKPPLTTWLMGVSTAVLGQTLLGVKLFALLGQAAVSVLGFAIARAVGDIRAGWWAWALLTTLPLVAAGGLIMSPDAVLLPLWMAALYMVVRALKVAEKHGDARALCWRRWLLLGVVIGLGGLAKYSAALFYPLLGVFLLVWKREWLLKPQVWVSGLVALAFQLPVLIWNMQHGWVGLKHVLWQAGAGEGHRAGGLATFGEFIGGQALVLGPVVFGLMLAALVLVKKDVRLRWLTLVTVGILAAFTVLSFTTKVQANWPLLGSVTGVLILAVWLGRLRKPWFMWLAMFGMLMNGVMTYLLMDTYHARYAGLLPLKAKNDPTKDLRGWDQMGELLGLMLYKLDNPVVLSSRYQTLAPLMFHTLGKPEFAYINAEGRRMNQYDLWPLPSFNDRLVVYVSEQETLPAKIGGLFTNCQVWHTLGVEEYELETRRLKLWLCWGAEGVRG